MGWSRPDEESRADHYRDERKHDFEPLTPKLNLSQRLSLSKLIGYSEAIAGSGLLSEDMELKLRTRIAEVLSDFNMPSQIDREPADA